MKIAITVSVNDPDSNVDPRFGRCAGFMIYDDEADSFDYLDNAQNLQAMQGAGIQSSQTVIDAGVKAVITGNVGPKAFATLNAAGVEIYTGASGTVKQAIGDLKNGRLVKSGGATKPGHW